jgi:hypothetical protein
MSMNWKNYYQKIERIGLSVAKWVAIISAFGAIIGGANTLLQWGVKGPFSQALLFFQTNYQILWLTSLTTICIVFGFRIDSLRSRFSKGFKDRFDGKLDDNWDYKGPWRIPERGTLIVTGSDEGGITKSGSHWENYSFSFDAKIISECIGVIVRAQDLNNYYMFQIRPDKIRPHRRIAVPVIIDGDIKGKNDNELKVNAVQYFIAWQTEQNSPSLNSIPIIPPLEDWFNIKISVKGQSVSIYIDGSLIYHRLDLLQIPTGKIGFRNQGAEEAQVKNVNVTLDPII